MRVLCIKSSQSVNKNAILVHKDSEYNVTKVTEGFILAGTENNIWYELLETGEYLHHSSLFALLPEGDWKEKLEEEFNNKIELS